MGTLVLLPTARGISYYLTWKSTHGGTCHLDSVLEAFVTLKACYGHELTNNDDGLVTAIQSYVQKRIRGATEPEHSELRDNIEEMLFAKHAQAYEPGRGADAGE